MPNIESIDLTLLATAIGGRRDANPGLPLGTQPVPSEWMKTAPPSGYAGGVPDGCLSRIGPNGKFDSRRQWAIPPTNCWAQPGDDTNNNGYGQ